MIVQFLQDILKHVVLLFKSITQNLQMNKQKNSVFLIWVTILPAEQ